MAHGARAAHPQRRRGRRRRRPGSARCGPRSCARRPARGRRPAGAPARARTALPVTARASRWAAEQPPHRQRQVRRPLIGLTALSSAPLFDTKNCTGQHYRVGPSRDQTAAADRRAHAGHSAHAAHCARRTTERRRPTCARTPSYLHSASAACEQYDTNEAFRKLCKEWDQVGACGRPPRARGRGGSPPAPPAASGRQRCPRRSWPASA